MIKAAQVAQLCRAQCDDPEFLLESMASLSNAGPTQLSFLMPGRAPDTQAGALLLRQEDQADYAGLCLFVENPYLAFAQASSLFDRVHWTDQGIDSGACVSEHAQVAEDVRICAGAVVEAGAVIAQGCYIGPNCVLGADSQIGQGSHLQANVTVYHGVRIGARARIHSGAVLGADGFGFAPEKGEWVKIHQLGGVWVGDDVEIGANTTIDRGALDDTRIEDGVKIDNQVMIAHNCQIGANTAIAACVGMAGSTQIGKNCTIAGAAGFTGHLSVCDNAHVGAMTLVAGDIRQPGAYAGGVQGARPMKDWKRNVARFNQLDQLAKRLIQLEKKITD